MAVPCVFEGNKQVQLRRGTTAENDAFTGAEGEVTYDTEQHRLRTHDGITSGGFAHALLSANTFVGNQSINGNTLLNIDGSASFGTNTLQITNAGVLLLPDGTEPVPSLAFVSEPDTGIYKFGAGQLAIAVGGSVQPASVFQSTGIWMGDRDIRWSFGFFSAVDTFLFRDGSLGIRALAGGFSIGAQLHLYNQNWVDALNWERLNLEWNGNESFLTTERIGTGQFRNLSLGSEGAATVSLRTNATNWFTLSATGLLVGTKPAILTTPTDNLQLLNPTAATAGFSSQYSPALRFTGQGWKTAAVAASQAVDWRIYNQPVQGTTNPSSNLLFDFSVDGGAFGNRLSLSSAGILTFFDGSRQTFNPDATNSGFNVGSVAGDPSVLVNGDIWYNSSTNELKGQVNGFTVVIAPAFPEPPFTDTNALVRGSVDVTKLLRFEVDGFTAFTTRVLTPQNANYTIAGIDIVNVFTSNQSVNGNILLNTDGSASFSAGVLTISTAGLITFPDGVRQTFNPDATNAGINVGAVAGDPSAPSNGDLWYDSTANELTARINGVNTPLVGATKPRGTYFHVVGTTRFERYHTAGIYSSAATTTAFAIGTLVAVPFVSTRGGTLDRIAFAVTTGGGAGSKARVGIYDSVSDIDPYPNTLVVDGGEYDSTVVGVKNTVINVALTPNKLYFLVYLCGTAAPTVRATTTNVMEPIYGMDNAFAATVGTVISVAQAYGALPGTFPSGGTINSAAVVVPTVGLRFSA